MVRPLRTRGYCDCYAADAEEHEDQCPPCEVGKSAVNGRYYGADESDNPSELSPKLACQLQQTAQGTETDHADRDGGKRKRIANDAADAKRRPLAVSMTIFHFAQRRRAQRGTRGHVRCGSGERGDWNGRAR